MTALLAAILATCAPGQDIKPGTVLEYEWSDPEWQVDYLITTGAKIHDLDNYFSRPNGKGKGQCTWLVQSLRPDEFPRGPGGTNNAHSWFDRFKAAGYATGQTPRDFSIPVWNSQVGGGAGHVALVIKSYDPDLIGVLDANWSPRLDGKVRYRILNWRTEKNLVGFIYWPDGQLDPPDSFFEEPGPPKTGPTQPVKPTTPAPKPDKPADAPPKALPPIPSDAPEGISSLDRLFGLIGKPNTRLLELLRDPSRTVSYPDDPNTTWLWERGNISPKGASFSSFIDGKAGQIVTNILVEDYRGIGILTFGDVTKYLTNGEPLKMFADIEDNSIAYESKFMVKPEGGYHLVVVGKSRQGHSLRMYGALKGPTLNYEKVLNPATSRYETRYVPDPHLQWQRAKLLGIYAGEARSFIRNNDFGNDPSKMVGRERWREIPMKR
jgi:hypothetical protein